MERAVILCPPDSPLLPEHLPQLTTPQPCPDPEAVLSASETSSFPTLEQMEQQLIEQAITRHEGNIQAAARDLGISRGTLYRKAEKFGITIDTMK